ncbi:MAG: hypothetical protein FJY54_03920 [Betaproteobacteria bacterium]|nr:hypothetical protein [Betaproteobacteria bacterium]
MTAGMIKYSFKIRTRGGMVVESLQVLARERAEAERKINQIYHHCEILECHEVTAPIKGEALDLEGVISLISKQEESK